MKSASRLKVGIVLDDSLDKPDGVQQYVLTIGKWLSAAGHEVHYLVSSTKEAGINNIHSLGGNVAVKFNGNRMNTPLPAGKRAIQNLLKKQKFDVLHVQLPYSPLLAGRVINAAGEHTAVVGTFHIFPDSKFVSLATRLLGLWSRKSLNRFDEIVSVSKAAQSFSRDTFKINSAVLPNAVNLEQFKSAKPFESSNQRNILFVGRLVPRKGCQYLLAAVEKLSKDDTLPPFAVTICGKGPLEPKLKKFVADKGLQDKVNFKGFVSESDKGRYMASADIAVFPSTGGESFGIVLVEAMAFGKAAVLAGNNPGYASVLGQLKEKVLFDPENTDELTGLLTKLLKNDSYRLRLAGSEYKLAQEYDIQNIGPKLVNMYALALSRRRNMQ